MTPSDSGNGRHRGVLVVEAASRVEAGDPRTRSSDAAGRGTVVVIGGGLAGTLTAWALRGLAARVIVLERDHFPHEPDFRPGVPQGRHAHLILEAGHRALNEMLPGLREELHSAGATTVAMSGDLRWLSSAGWMATHNSRLGFLSCTRPVLDHVVRTRVLTEAQAQRVDGAAVGSLEGTVVEFRESCEVVGLLGSTDAVTGVRFRSRGSGEPVHELRGQWVVDASGRSSSVPRWFSELGCPPVPELRVDAGVAYLSRQFHRPPADAGFSALYLQTRAPDAPFTGALLPVERHRWLVSLGKMDATNVGRGEQGFEAMLSQMRDPVLRETLSRAEPASEVRGYRPGPSVRRRYERIAPEGFVAIGDAACTFNPVYGQGCSIVALGAKALREAVLQHGGIGRAAARAARHQIAAVAQPAWLMSSTEDTRFATTVGGPSGAFTRVQHRYLDQVLQCATTDTRVTAAFHEVMSLVAPPLSLFRPQILGRVLLGSGAQR